jgi:hypothetical protein
MSATGAGLRAGSVALALLLAACGDDEPAAFDEAVVDDALDAAVAAVDLEEDTGPDRTTAVAVDGWLDCTGADDPVTTAEADLAIDADNDVVVRVLGFEDTAGIVRAASEEADCAADAYGAAIEDVFDDLGVGGVALDFASSTEPADGGTRMRIEGELAGFPVDVEARMAAVAGRVVVVVGSSDGELVDRAVEAAVARVEEEG